MMVNMPRVKEGLRSMNYLNWSKREPETPLPIRQHILLHPCQSISQRLIDVRRDLEVKYMHVSLNTCRVIEPSIYGAIELVACPEP